MSIVSTAIRRNTFECIVRESGRIKRGILIDQMMISEQTFSREYKSFLELSINITYDSKKREFTWSN